MEANICECRFCGGTMIIETSTPLMHDEAALAAVQKCECIGAKRYRRVARAHEAIDNLAMDDRSEFEPLDDAVVSLMKGVAEAIIMGKIDKARLDTDSETVALSADKYGEIKLSRKRTVEIVG